MPCVNASKPVATKEARKAKPRIEPFAKQSEGMRTLNEEATRRSPGGGLLERQAHGAARVPSPAPAGSSCVNALDVYVLCGFSLTVARVSPCPDVPGSGAAVAIRRWHEKICGVGVGGNGRVGPH